jgi:hypothetical protein
MSHPGIKLLCQSCLFLCLILQKTYAQHIVTIEIAQLPEQHAEEPVFITGNFNGWMPAQPALQMLKSSSGAYTIALNDIHD